MEKVTNLCELNLFDFCSITDEIESISLNCDHVVAASKNEIPLRYKILSLDEVVSDMNKFVNEVNHVLDKDIPPKIIKNLLNRYKWDKDTLFEEYFAAPNQETFFQAADVINPYSNDASNSADLELSTAKCDICWEITEVNIFHCGHKFCTICWMPYLKRNISMECEKFSCPNVECKVSIDEVVVTKLLNDSPEIQLKYYRLISKDFVMRNPNLHYCPSTSCYCVIKTLSYDCEFVTCACGKNFCCTCYEGWHAPIPCEQLGKWNTIHSVNLEYRLVAHGVKICPHCYSLVESPLLSSDVLCRICTYSFCWYCLKSKTDIKDPCSCVPDLIEDVKTNNKFLKKLCTPDSRLNFCYNNFDEHRRCHLKAVRLQAENDSKRNYFIEALDVLIDCRRILMYSYAFLYYLIEDNNAAMLELMLQDFGTSTEKLTTAIYGSVLPDLESQFKEENNLKQKIRDSQHACESLRKNLLEMVQEGINEGHYTYRE